MLFSVICFDRPGVLSKRDAIHPQHVEYVQQRGDTVHAGGPFLTDSGTPVGAMFILNIVDHAAAEEWIQHEPFYLAGLYEMVLIRRWMQVIPPPSESGTAAAKH